MKSRIQPVGTIVLSLLLAPLACSGVLNAQTAQHWSIQGSALFAGLFGRAYGGLNDGVGAELQLRYTPSRFSVGAGGQLTMHKLTGSGEANDVRLWGAFVEPRFRVPTASHTFAPYLSMRFSYLKLKISSNATVGSSGGVTINGGGGVLMRLGSRLNLDLGATYGYTNFEALRLENRTTGQIITSPLGNGSNVVIRSGFALGLFN